eukprot:scpid75294/ scgid30588/ 
MNGFRAVLLCGLVGLALLSTASGGYLSGVGVQRRPLGSAARLRERNCPQQNPTVDGYVFQPLLNKDVWALHGQPCNDTANPADRSCSYYFTFCQALPQSLGLHENCSTASVCKVNDAIDPPETTSLGEYNTFQYSNRVSIDARGEFVIDFEVPDEKIITALAFFCNATLSWTDIPTSFNESLAPGLIGVVHSGYDSMFDMQFFYDGACYSGSSSPSGGLNGGAVFAIVLFSLIIAYVIGGTFINMAFRERNGIQAFPNYGTWSKIFGFIGGKLGCNCTCPDDDDDNERSSLLGGEHKPLISAGGGAGPASSGATGHTEGVGFGGSFERGAGMATSGDGNAATSGDDGLVDEDLE